jgi:hypothetical protein
MGDIKEEEWSLHPNCEDKTKALDTLNIKSLPESMVRTI